MFLYLCKITIHVVACNTTTKIYSQVSQQQEGSIKLGDTSTYMQLPKQYWKMSHSCTSIPYTKTKQCMWERPYGKSIPPCWNSFDAGIASHLIHMKIEVQEC